MPSRQDIPITCARCKGKAPMREMKYNTNGKDLICSRCYDIKITQARKPRAAGHYAEPIKKNEIIDTLEANKEIKYFCSKCKFKFSRMIKNGIPKACPNCGKGTLTEQYKGDAQELIKDSLKEDFNY